MMRNGMMSHYLFQAIPLLNECQTSLVQLQDKAPVTKRYRTFLKLQECLQNIDELIFEHTQQFVGPPNDPSDDTTNKPRTALETLMLLERTQQKKTSRDDTFRLQNPQDAVHHCLERPYSPYDSGASKTAIDTLLFRLIVDLELLLVRIDDARYVILGHRSVERNNLSSVRLSTSAVMLGMFAGTCLVAWNRQRCRTQQYLRLPEANQLLRVTGKFIGTVFVGKRLMNALAKFWMRDKLVRSTNDLNEWTSQWNLIHRSVVRRGISTSNSLPNASNGSMSLKDLFGPDEKSMALIEHEMKRDRKTYFWLTTGEIRFLMVKRFMDVYYASVGTAITSKQTSSLTLPLVTGAAASFYSITGVSQKALNVVVNDSSCELIRHAW